MNSTIIFISFINSEVRI